MCSFTPQMTARWKWSEAAAEVHDILQDDIHHEDVDLFWSGTSGWADNCFLLLFLSALYLFPQRIIEKKSCIWMCLSIISHYICKKLKKCNKVQSYKSFSSSSGSSLSLCPGSEIHEFWQRIIHVNVQLLNYSQLFSSLQSLLSPKCTIFFLHNSWNPQLLVNLPFCLLLWFAFRLLYFF